MTDPTSVPERPDTHQASDTNETAEQTPLEQYPGAGEVRLPKGIPADVQSTTAAAFIGHSRKNPRRYEWVPLPEMEATENGHPAGMWIQSGTGLERDAFELRNSDDQGNIVIEGLRAALLIVSAVDKPGTGSRLLFTDADKDDINKFDAGIMTRLFKVAQRLWGFTDDAVVEAGKG